MHALADFDMLLGRGKTVAVVGETGAGKSTIARVLREIFPIESYDKSISLDYVRYELGKPRYEPDECRQLRLTYGRPFRVWLRLTKEQPIEEEVYLGDMPIMLGGGEFIINGAERVVVSQLVRSPGAYFTTDTDPNTGRQLCSAKLIPYRGAWVELETSNRDLLSVKVDRKRKAPISTLLRALGFQVTLLSARGIDQHALCAVADALVEAGLCLGR